MQYRAHAVLIQIGRLVRAAGQIVVRLLFCIQLPAVEETHRFVEHPVVAGGENVAAERQRQPQVVVGTTGTHATIRSRMPPVLDVTFAELVGRAAQEVFARKPGLGMDERHHVLQLVAKTESAARLIVAATRPQPACQRLIDQPAVGQHIERRIRGFHLHRAQGAFPVLPHFLESTARS